VAEPPFDARHFYRLGALYAYMGEYERAMATFRRAMNARYVLAGPLSAFWAEEDVRSIGNAYGEQARRSWARLTASAAEILHHGSKDARSDLLKIKEDPFLWLHSDDSVEVSMRIVRELLETALPGGTK
jgi:hypothetical protein